MTMDATSANLLTSYEKEPVKELKSFQTSQFSADFSRLIEEEVFGWVDRYFRVHIEGEGVRSLHKEQDTPLIFVANHSIGALFEAILLMRFLRRAGLRESLRIPAHRVSFIAPLKWFRPRRLGVFEASYREAAKEIDRGHSLLVFPGGDQECFRLFARRYEVNFFGRQGFARLAIEKNVKIVPISITGAHALWIQIVRIPILNRFLEKRVRGKGFSLNLETLIVCIAFGWANAAFKLLALLAWILPWPSKIKVRLHSPIEIAEASTVSSYAYGPVNEEARAQNLAHVVETKIQEGVKRDSRSRRTPWG